MGSQQVFVSKYLINLQIEKKLQRKIKEGEKKEQSLYDVTTTL
jgi:hypothetical protein